MPAWLLYSLGYLLMVGANGFLTKWALRSVPWPTLMVATTLAYAVLVAFAALRGWGEVLPIIDALRRREIEFLVCRHESDAGIMAAVYGKAKGVPGVVLTTLGPGASNLLLPIASSLLDREPLIAISAQTPDSWSSYR